MEQIKVLMIDDDEVIAASTAEYFNMFDVRTEYVTGFDEAERFLETHLVSLLLLEVIPGWGWRWPLGQYPKSSSHPSGAKLWMGKWPSIAKAQRR